MRETCGREIPTGTCAELEGHKSVCMTAEEIKKYNEQMAVAEAERREARQRRINEELGR